jgi:hypothetical protein
MQIKLEKMKSLKTKPRKAKRDDWKQAARRRDHDRKVARNTKRIIQEKMYA